MATRWRLPLESVEPHETSPGVSLRCCKTGLRTRFPPNYWPLFAHCFTKAVLSPADSSPGRQLELLGIEALNLAVGRPRTHLEVRRRGKGPVAHGAVVWPEASRRPPAEFELASVGKDAEGGREEARSRVRAPDLDRTGARTCR
jgi:hypothetical protein